ncbi:MAG: hypothetical protein R3C68_01185 [Myxococcota bacterium]
MAVIGRQDWTIAENNVELFRTVFHEAVIAAVGPPPYTATLRPDVEISARHLSLSMVDEFQELGPFGQANPEPYLSAGLACAQQTPCG